MTQGAFCWLGKEDEGRANAAVVRNVDARLSCLHIRIRVPLAL